MHDSPTFDLMPSLERQVESHKPYEAYVEQLRREVERGRMVDMDAGNSSLEKPSLSQTKQSLSTAQTNRHGTLLGWYRALERENTATLELLSPVAVVLAEVAIGVLVLIGIEIVATLVPVAGIVLYGLALLYSTASCAYSFFDEFLSELRNANRALILGIMARTLMIQVVAYSEISRYLYLAFGGYQAPYTDYWHWLRYGIVRSLDEILFGSVSAFGPQMVIRETAFWSRVLLVFFNVSIGLIILSAIWRQLRIVSSDHSAPVHRQPTNYLQQLFWHQYELVSVIVLITVGTATIFVVRDQQTPFIAVVMIMLVVGIGAFGIWLGAQSITAIRRFGGWSRVGAVGGLLLGWSFALSSVFLGLLLQASWVEVVRLIGRL